MSENVGWSCRYHPQSLMIGFSVDWSGLWKTDYSPTAPNCRRLWLCLNLVFWQISYSKIWKTYGIRGSA